MIRVQKKETKFTPPGRGYHATCVDSNAIICFGGCYKISSPEGYPPLNDLLRYENDNWTEVTKGRLPLLNNGKL